MTTHFDEADFVPLCDFELAWRFTDPRRSWATETLGSPIKPLTASRGRELYASSPLAAPLNGDPESSPLVVTRRQSLEASDPEEEATCNAWFEALPVDPATRVVVCWNAAGGVAVVSNWETFLAAWDDFWYPFDLLCVFDASGDWAVLFGPGEEARFAEKAVRPIPA